MNKETNMTYRELLEKLQAMSADRLDDTVTVYEPYEDEYIAAVELVESTEENDVLDPGHLIMVLKA